MFPANLDFHIIRIVCFNLTSVVIISPENCCKFFHRFDTQLLSITPVTT